MNHIKDVAENPDFVVGIHEIPLTTLRLQVWIFSILWLTLVFPVVIGGSSSCLSEYWCVGIGSDDPCTFYSSQTGADGQLCSCVGYQHNFTVCLTNVSAPVIFKLLILKLLMSSLVLSLSVLKYVDTFLVTLDIFEVIISGEW